MADAQPRQVVNVHGRRWGRGARPWLLMVKLVGVAAFLGGLLTLLAVAWQDASQPDRAGGPSHTTLIVRTYRCVIVPGVIGAEIAGVLLLASIWRVMLRMRWFLLKAGLLIVGLPALHLYLSSRVAALAEAGGEGMDPTNWATLDRRVFWGTLAALVVGLAVAWLGRIKPRLGQDFGRTFARRKS